MVSSVSPETEHTPVKAMTVSRESPATPVSDSSLLWRAPEGPKSQAAVPVGGGGARPDYSQYQSVAGAEGAGGTEEPGCGARGRRRGLAGLRGDAPSEARGADGSRAGRRPPAHTAARPHNPAQQAPRTPAAAINTTTGTARTRPGIQKTDIRDRMSACGGARGIRTPDLLIANETRYQLRHSPKDSDSLAPWRSATQADHDRVRHDTGRFLEGRRAGSAACRNAPRRTLHEGRRNPWLSERAHAGQPLEQSPHTTVPQARGPAAR